MLLVLGVILSAAAYLLLGILLLVASILLNVLFIPFGYRIQGHRHEGDAMAEGRLSWLFGLGSMIFSFDGDRGFSMRLMLFSHWPVRLFSGSKDGRLKATEKKRGKKKAAAAKKRERRKFHLTVDKLKLFVRAGMHIVKCMLPRQLTLDCRIGFENPAHTGMLCAAVSPLRPLLTGGNMRYNIRLMPVFDESEVSGDILIRGRIIIWFIVWEALKLAISKPFRQDIFGRKNTRIATTGGGNGHV